jgi:hypothetical protein
LAGIRRKQSAQALLGCETDREHDVLAGIVVVVDLHLIEDVVVEWEVVRSIARFEQRIDVEDHRHFRRVVVTHEREPVSDVGLVIERRDGSFTMIRCEPDL